MIGLMKRRVLIGMIAMLAIPSFTALAHVKWFAAWDFADEPVALNTVLTPLFLGLTALTLAGLAAAVWIDHKLRDSRLYHRVAGWFDVRRLHAPLVLRIGLGMTFILAWADDRLLTPDLPLTHPVWGWVQFGLALLLIFPAASAIAGLGTLGLYALGVWTYGAFYMLDYFIFVGVGVYLIADQLKAPRLHNLRLPALYFGVGFSLSGWRLKKSSIRSGG